jgi:hypothetical protein
MEIGPVVFGRPLAGCALICNQMTRTLETGPTLIASAIVFASGVDQVLLPVVEDHRSR